MAPRPTNADSGRGELFRVYRRSRPAAYALALGAAGTFVWGASRRDPVIMAGGPAAVIALVVLTCAVLADRSAARGFYRQFAESLGLIYWPRMGLAPLTPLLGAGDRRWCEHWMSGTLPGQPPLEGGIGQLVWEERQDTRSGNHPTRRHRMTICTVDLEPSIVSFRGIFLRPRPGVIPGAPNWLGSARTRALSVESAAFERRYQLLVAEGQDELMARQLLSPWLVLWLSEHPLSPAFELRAGMLVVYVDRVLEDEGGLTFLLDATRTIAARVASETAEAAARPAAVSPGR